MIKSKNPELKKEIDLMVNFFIKTDLEIFGYVTDSTKAAIIAQRKRYRANKPEVEQ